MKVVMISTDRNIFEEESAVRERMAEYGTIVDELRIVVFSRRTHNYAASHIATNVIAYPTSSRTRLGYIIDGIRVGKRVARELGKDLIVSAQDPFETGIVGWLVAKFVKAKLQLQIHTDFLSPYFKGLSFLNRLRVFIAKRLIPRADNIRVVSERIKQSIAEQGIYTKSEPVVLPIYVDAGRIASVQPVDLAAMYPQFNKYVLIASRLEPEKDIAIALRSFATACKGRGIGLIIAGAGSEEDELRKLVASLDIEKQAVFIGWQKNIIAYLKSASVLLLTSRFEGYGLTLAEAALSGCPIVTTNVGIVGNILVDKQDVLACSVGDVACITGALASFFDNVMLQQSLRQNAQRHIQQSLLRNKSKFLSKFKESLL